MGEAARCEHCQMPVSYCSFHPCAKRVEALEARVDELESRIDGVHVVPDFGGRPHECAPTCWCGPRADPETLDRTKYERTLWVHEVEQ